MNFKSTLFVIMMSIYSISFASTPQSANVIKFGDANTLFIGDSKSATLYAYNIKSNDNPTAQQGYNIHDLSSKIAQFSKINPFDILIRDMAIRPTSKEAYIAFDTKTRTGYAPQIVIVNQAGSIKKFDLEKTKHTEIQLNDAPTSDFKFWDKTPMRTLTFTDIDFYNGKVYISGMSNAEFSSALRIVDYPFNKSKVATSSVEIFHAVHGQMETRAPIQTLQFVTLNNEDYILAAYTCTPLVLIPVKDLKNEAHIVGKTIAEMGYGNTPVDIIKFTSKDADKNPYETIILSNRNQSAQSINLTDITTSSKTESIGYVGAAGQSGTPATNLPLTGLMQIDDQDDSHFTAVRRDQLTGELELISFLKNVNLRLDEYISEYDQPSYKYEGEQAQMKDAHNMMLKDLGLPLKK
ncbi:hypothetical protein [uncultured Aquimarina sp.]|uniref:hypothetical protein n=1 Tax=uncultured Aquimarina sp. TaxID=575652 RepID=UPI00260E7C02|nr:hypothetical protein [uncultured Aquimarina sp.]